MPLPTIANVSQHLQHLRPSGFVRSRRDGKRVLYRLRAGPVPEFLSALRIYAEHSRTEIDRIVADYFHRLDELEPVSRRNLLTRLGDESVTVLDVRPEDEFSLGHLPGALNIPFDEIEVRFKELPTTREIVAYCRGPYCILSFKVIAYLRTRGYLVQRLEGGLKDMGLTVTIAWTGKP